MGLATAGAGAAPAAVQTEKETILERDPAAAYDLTLSEVLRRRLRLADASSWDQLLPEYVKHVAAQAAWTVWRWYGRVVGEWA